MIPISGRTSLEGHTIALQERGSALIISLDRMDKILEVNEMNGDAVVQAVSAILGVRGVPHAEPAYATRRALGGRP